MKRKKFKWGKLLGNHKMKARGKKKKNRRKGQEDRNAVIKLAGKKRIRRRRKIGYTTKGHVKSEHLFSFQAL